MSYGRDDSGKRGWAISGLVTGRAEGVEVETPAGPRPAQLVAVPESEAEATKAFVSFLPYEDDPRRLVAFDAGGDRIALQDLPRR